MGYQLGVDLGTTWTAAAVARDDRTVSIVGLGGQSNAIPTVLYVQADGEWLVGEPAVRRAISEPDRVTREFKRRVGDTVPVLVAGSPYSAESLLVTVLHWVVSRVSQLEGGPPDAIVVTHPANWGPLRRELLEQAIRHGGLTATLTTEPEAAAVHYASATRVPEGTVFAVYDLGGGTFDASVLRKTADGFAVLGQPEGIERFGGLDIDAAVLNHVTASFAPTWDALDADDPAVVACVTRLRDDCVRAKEALSDETDTSIPVVLPMLSTEVRLTRRELEDMIRPQVEQSADVLQRAIANAGVPVAEVDRILLVGGSSRIPLIAQVLAQRFERPIAVDAHPKDSIALGAARLAMPQLVAPPSVGPAPPAPPSPPAAAASPVPPRRPGWLVPAVVVAVVLLAIAAFALTRGSDTEHAASSSSSSSAGSAAPASSGSSDSSSPVNAGAGTGVRSLEGRWLLTGPPEQCVGLSDTDCDGFKSRGVRFNFEIRCNATGCGAAMGESEFAPLTGSGPFVATGALNEADGFQCQGAPDPTTWTVEIDDPHVTGAASTFTAKATLTSPGTESDGLSCVAELLSTTTNAVRR